ncbi:hypothetical protein EPUS_08178 [Endocarpon pusillum Z07020]|uniref:Uncharacterized protein n=1 Tax=Endocarpon pusillum (strain Z07020 / HMAS-L-300199) TaxID=1263415 RepID=U1HJ51_ENDPU|nr:uncharacterized protein EPUS_08178 [Endocarpon pusillum Z07020]ERF68944.1 hypothetical protein EPUS_08178 [Endocarpon pusillum Z07020]
MASAPMNALASFMYLTDMLPTWITQINTLGTHVVTKREEFSAEYKRALEHARPRRKKTPSVTSLQTNQKPVSIRSQKSNTNAQDMLSIPRASEISPLDPESKYLFANARRGKRKQGASFRSGASGPQAFRNQHQVIIYYDSVLQDGFEALVKEIGTARNNVRKGRQARELERGLRLPSFGMGNYTRTQRGPVMPSPPKSRSPTDLTVDPKILLNDAPPNEDASFTEVANQLEAAQALCETAAHQFLRDGDCTLEIDRIRSYLENVLQVAKRQIEAWEQEEDGARTEGKEAAALVKKENHDVATVVAEKLGVNITPMVNTVTQTTEIEVDSDDNSVEEDIVVDITKFRSARASGIRA